LHRNYEFIWDKIAGSDLTGRTIGLQVHGAYAQVTTGYGWSGCGISSYNRWFGQIKGHDICVDWK